QQPPAQPPAGPAPGQPHRHPDPTNLQVLPKTLTGDQLDEIMDGWAASLGVHCDTCHTADPAHPRPDGRPGLNFADDSKPEKATARKMFQMMEEINRNYIAKIDSSGAPVTCGTCHRGHLGPQPFVVPKEGHHGPSPAQPK
ncbi:MAG: c-type cytochrome, partial [Terracidiphilus sp.]